jgi:glutamate-1-semialdehyde aminotransferase
MEIKKRDLTQSRQWWDRALKVIMDGTQLYSKGPMINIFGVAPTYLRRGEAGHVWDVDGNEYVDYTSGVGSVILGYGYPAVKEAIARQLEDGTNLGLIHPLEVEVAELLCETVPCAEMVRFLKTGGSATSAAIRLARAFTGRELVIKGDYHGWQDWTMAHAKRNAGIPKALRDTVFHVEYNDLDAVRALLEAHPGQFAALITEPVELHPPKPGYLEDLKALLHEHGALMIFDEVVTGFRFAPGGAQQFFGVTPDMACFGKGLSNGMPLSAVTGRREIFETVKDRIFMSTTFGGEMLSLAAAQANITEIRTKPVLDRVWALGKRLQDGANSLAGRIGVPMKCIGYPCRILMTAPRPDGTEDINLKSLFLQETVKRGVLMAWQMFPMYTHTDRDIDLTLEAFEDAMTICKKADDAGDVTARLEGPPVRWVEVL